MPTVELSQLYLGGVLLSCTGQFAEVLGSEWLPLHELHLWFRLLIEFLLVVEKMKVLFKTTDLLWVTMWPE